MRLLARYFPYTKRCKQAKKLYARKFIIHISNFRWRNIPSYLSDCSINRTWQEIF